MIRNWIQRRKRRIAKDILLQRHVDDGDLERPVGVGFNYDKVEAGGEDISSAAFSKEPEDKERLTISATVKGSGDVGVVSTDKGGETNERVESDRVRDIRRGGSEGALTAGGTMTELVENDEEGSSGETSTGGFGESNGGRLPATSVRQNKRPFRILSSQRSSPEGVQGKSEGMERLAMGGISGSDGDARVEAADKGVLIGELDESGRALGIRGENACSEAVAAGDMVAGETDAAQGTSGDGDGVGGDTAAGQGILDDGDGGGGSTVSTGVKTKPIEWAKMSKSQRTRWRRGNKK